MTYRSEKLRYCAFGILIFMILSRVIWIQLRTYEQPLLRAESSLVDGHDQNDPCKPTKSQLASNVEKIGKRLYALKNAEQLCRWYKSSLVQTVIWINRVLYLATVLLAAFFIRFLISSWLMALMAANIALSRGALLASLDQLMTDHLLGFFIMLWATCMAHYTRSSSRLVFIGAMLAGIAASLCDFSCWPILLSPAVLLMGGYMKCFHASNISESSPNLLMPKPYAAISLLDSAPSPFESWINVGGHRSAALKISIVGFSCWLGASFFLSNHSWMGSGQVRSQVMIDAFITDLLTPIDLHYSLCLAAIVLSCHRWWGRSLVSFAWFSRLIVLVTLSTVLWVFFVDTSMTISPMTNDMHFGVSRWFEPLILTFGFAALYNLFRIASLGTKTQLRRA